MHDFVQSLIALHAEVNKETDIAVIDKKCQKIMNAYKEEDHDAADGILDDIKQAKNKLILFPKKPAANEWISLEKGECLN